MTGRFAFRSAGALTEKYLPGFLLAGRITVFPRFLADGRALQTASHCEWWMNRHLSTRSAGV
jgi:hypothetical protein